MNNCFQSARASGPPRPPRSYWPQNPELPSNAPHWSADESLVRPHRAVYRGAIRERKDSLIMAAQLGCTLEELRDLQ